MSPKFMKTPRLSAVASLMLALSANAVANSIGDATCEASSCFSATGDVDLGKFERYESTDGVGNHPVFFWISPSLNIGINANQKLNIKASSGVVDFETADGEYATIQAQDNASNINFNLKDATWIGNFQTSQNAVAAPLYSKSPILTGYLFDGYYHAWKLPLEKGGYALVGNIYGVGKSGMDANFNFINDAGMSGNVSIDNKGENIDSKLTLNFVSNQDGMNYLTGDIRTQDSNGKPQINVKFSGAGSSRLTGDIRASAGEVVLNFDAQTINISTNPNIELSSSTYSQKDFDKNTSVKMIFTHEGSIRSDLINISNNPNATYASNQQLYIQGSQDKKLEIIGAQGKEVEIAITGPKAGGNHKLYITDYALEPQALNVEQAKGSLNLLAKSLTLSGNGEKSIMIDFYAGSAVFKQVAVDGRGHHVSVNFRDALSNTAITFGDGATPMELKTGGGNGEIFLQAKEINIYGDLSADGVNHKIGSVSTTQNTLNITGSFRSFGNTLLDYSKGESAITIGGGLSVLGQTTQIKLSSLTKSSALKLDSLVAEGGKFYLYSQDQVRNFVSPSAVEQNVFEGQLNIAKGIRAGVRGENTILFRAASLDNPVISGEREAILAQGNGALNQLYLEDSSSLGAAPMVLGDIVAKDQGKNNLYFKGKSSSIALSGDIYTLGGSNNIIFNHALWTPSNQATDALGKLIATGGETNLVLRMPAERPKQVQSFEIQSQNDARVNAVMQNFSALDAILNYKDRSVMTLVFAKTNEGSDAYGEGQSDLAHNKILGSVYKDGIKLTLKDFVIKNASGEEISFVQRAGGGTLRLKAQSDLQGGVWNDVITMSGVGVGSIEELGNNSNHNYHVTLNEGAIFAGNIHLDLSKTNVDLRMKQGSKLILNTEFSQIGSLDVGNAYFNQEDLLKNTFDQRNTLIDIATMGNDLGEIPLRNAFHLLKIGQSANADKKGLMGSGALFRVYVNSQAKQATLGKNNTQENPGVDYGNVYADRIIIHQGEAGTHYLQAIYAPEIDLTGLSYHGGGTEREGNIALASIKAASGVKFEGMMQIQGFDVLQTELESVATDEYGKASGKDYTTYFVKRVNNLGASESMKKTTSSALGLNYELFLANFNSLNKRMGELRDNNHSQGAWARIFNGRLKTDFGLKTYSIYTTIQAGYDYAFGFEGANNYVGFALAYANALSKPKTILDFNGDQRGIEKSTSNAVEFAIYNSYVQDEGWYNDTIAKFSYILSDLSLTGHQGNYNTHNFGFIFSEEFGYRFKLGETKEWYIDPQLELGLGYFNQSNLKQVLGQASLDGVQKAIWTLRARFGAAFGFDFKNFIAQEGIKASVYFGAFYAHDEIKGGKIDLTSSARGQSSVKDLHSTGRFEFNVGTNVNIQDHTRLYFDFERSFGGAIATQYQFSLGVRYSFGAGNGYIPYPEKTQIPLKIDQTDLQQTQEQ